MPTLSPESQILSSVAIWSREPGMRDPRARHRDNRDRDIVRLLAFSALMRGARSKDRRPRAGGSWSVLSLTVLGIVGLVLVQFFLVAFRAEGVRSGSPHGASPHSMVVTPPLPGAGSSVGSGSQVPQTPNPAARPPPASLPAVRVRRQATGQDASHIGVVLPYKGSKNIGNPIKVDLRVYMNDAWGKTTTTTTTAHHSHHHCSPLTPLAPLCQRRRRRRRHHQTLNVRRGS